MADSILEIAGRVGSSVRAVSTSTGIGLRTRAHGAGVSVDMTPDSALRLGEWLVEQARAQGADRRPATDASGAGRGSVPAQDAAPAPAPGRPPRIRRPRADRTASETE